MEFFLKSTRGVCSNGMSWKFGLNAHSARFGSHFLSQSMFLHDRYKISQVVFSHVVATINRWWTSGRKVPQQSQAPLRLQLRRLAPRLNALIPSGTPVSRSQSASIMPFARSALCRPLAFPGANWVRPDSQRWRAACRGWSAGHVKSRPISSIAEDTLVLAA